MSAATTCTSRGYHRTDASQWASLPVTLTVRCKDCGERLWDNDPAASSTQATSFNK